MMTAAMVVVMMSSRWRRRGPSLLLHEILRQTAQNTSTDCAQEPMVRLLAQEVPRHTATDGAQQTTVALRHRRRIRIVVRGIRVA